MRCHRCIPPHCRHVLEPCIGVLPFSSLACLRGYSTQPATMLGHTKSSCGVPLASSAASGTLHAEFPSRYLLGGTVKHSNPDVVASTLEPEGGHEHLHESVGSYSVFSCEICPRSWVGTLHVALVHPNHPNLSRGPFKDWEQSDALQLPLATKLYYECSTFSLSRKKEAFLAFCNSDSV